MQTKEWTFGYHALKALLAVYPDYILEIYLQENRQDKRVQEILDVAQQLPIPVKWISKDKLDQILNSTHHQGMAALCKNLPTYTEKDIPQLLAIHEGAHLILALDGIQDPHNLGACLRTANAMGVQMVIIPKDRAVSLTPAVRKIASGAAETTPLIPVTNLARTLRVFKEAGIWLVGTAEEAPAVLSTLDLKGSIALVMGGEENGLRALTRKECDYLARIPLTGTVTSLNVSVATGICLYEVSRQRYAGSAI